MKKKKSRGTLEQAMAKAKVQTAKRHVFLCLGPDCCDPGEGETTWGYIKKRVGELDLDVMRTKALCFRMCQNGPWLVVYPDGIWYSQVTPDRFERILQEHLLGNKPIQEWIMARNSLGMRLCSDTEP